MNLVVIAALVAVAGAAKLDRTYLPPASAKTAGGSPGALQTPFAGNALNNGLGGLPKGSYSNDFEGVVVDAAAAGTRASEDGDTGLGAPRIAYGSTNSKVGAAAFKTNQAGFRQPADGFQTGFDGTAFDGQAAGTETQGFQAQPSQFSNAERPRAALDRAANTIRFETEVGPENYHFAYETDNGIAAEENGIATNGVQAQGGFSYTGDDGQVYTLTYTADEGGFQPKGDHLPTPPPIPEEILKSLEQNARDEAAGLLDDGSYDAQKYNAGSDYAESDNANGKYNHQSSKFGNKPETDATASGTFISQNNQPFVRPGQSGQFGQSVNSPTGSENTASEVFNSNAGFGQPGASKPGASNSRFGSSFNSDSRQSGQVPTSQGQFGSSSNKLGPSSQDQGQFGSSSNRFGQASPQSQFGSGSNNFGQSSQGAPQAQFGSSLSRFGQPTQETTRGQVGFGANKSGQSGQIKPQGQFGASSTGLKQSSSGSQDSNGLTGPSGFNQDKEIKSAANQQSNNFAQEQSAPANKFGNRNEYLPPNNAFNQNQPQNFRSQGSGGVVTTSTINEESNDIIENGNFQSFSQNSKGQNKPQGSESSAFSRPSSNGITSQSRFGSQNSVPNSSDNDFVNSGNTIAGVSSQPSRNGFGSRNEYLPPVNSFNQNIRPTQGRPGSKSQFGQQYNAQSSGDVQSAQNQGQLQGSVFSTGSAAGSQPAFGGTFSQQLGFQKTQTNGKPDNQNGNRFPSTQGGSSQSTFGVSSLNSQQSTSQPDTELTTPLETSGLQQVSTDVASSPTVASRISPGLQSSNRRPTSQIGTNTNNGLSSSPVPASSSTFPLFGRQPNASQKPGSRPVDDRQSQSAFPTQASEAQYTQEPQFGNRQPQSSQSAFSQSSDVQSSPSTPKPTFSQQSQGLDDSYYYNQPSKPFSSPQGSRFPSAPSNQFNRLSQQSSYQGNQFAKEPQPNPPTAFPSRNGQSQGSTKYPRPPTLASIAPTSSSQNQSPFITQASISPFPSEAPTQSTQFNQQGQFGPRPSYQQTNQFKQELSQPSKPTFGKPIATQSRFSQPSSSVQPSGQQTSITPTFPTIPGRGNKPFFQNQNPIEQQSLNQGQAQSSVDTSESVPSQQYDGEIYEYKKPAQTLPAPDHDHESNSGSGKFGQKTQNQFSQSSGPQSGQPQDSDDSQSSTTSQFGQIQGSRPQFGTPSRTQFGQNAQVQSSFGAKDQSTQGRPQFGQTSKPFGSSQNSQINQGSVSQEPEPTLGSAPQLVQGKPFGAPCCQESKFGQAKPTQGAFRRPNQGFSQTQTAGQFGAQSAEFPSTQGFKPEPTTNSFAGKGEVFGGPRKPPSFDPETGYHY